MPGLLMHTPGIGDLFGDSATTSLRQRIDDLRIGSCAQRIAWGKLGCIANITADGRGVEIRHLMCRPIDGVWTLSKPTQVPRVDQAHENQPIAHLSWNMVGSDLAIVDILGRVSIFTVFMSVDRLNCLRPGAMDHQDDLGMLVAFWWLNMDRPFHICKPAVRDPQSGQWRYPPSQQFKPVGTYNPIAGRSTSIGLTRNGVVKLWYGQDQSRIHEVSSDLENGASMKDLFSHASFTADKDGSIILSGFTHGGQLKIYKIIVNWNVPPPQPGKPIQQLTNPATLTIQRLKVEDLAIPQNPGSNSSSQAQLTIVKFLGPSPPSLGGSPHPQILAFYTSPSARPNTIVCRWEMVLTAGSLHAEFLQLANRKNTNTADKEVYELRRLPDVHFNGCVMNATQIFATSTLSIAYSDGSLHFVDNTTLEPIVASEDCQTINNLMHAGFAFSNLNNYCDFALSPNSVAAAVLNHHGDVRISMIRHEKDIDTDQATKSHIAAALAQQHAYSCNNHFNNDDLLMLAKQFSSPSLEHAFLTESHQAIGLNMDFLAETTNEKLLRNASLQRCLSLQNALYYKGDVAPKTMASKIALTTLSLKMSSVAFAYFINNVARLPANARSGDGESKAVALQSLLGIVKWEMDLHIYLTDELFELARKTRGRYNDMNFIRQMVKESNSGALPLVLASAPRWLLRYNSRALRGFDQTARDSLALPQGVEEDHRQTLQSLRAVLDQSPLKLSVFERILSDIDGAIKAVHRDNNSSTIDRTLAERTIFLTGDIPERFEPIVERLLTQSLPALWNDIEPSAIFFYDTTWLGFHDDAQSLEYRRTHRIDNLRKVPLKASAKIRRCIRCCEMAEDLIPNRNLGLWLQSMSRMCVCGSLWMRV